MEQLPPEEATDSTGNEISHDVKKNRGGRAKSNAGVTQRCQERPLKITGISSVMMFFGGIFVRYGVEWCGQINDNHREDWPLCRFSKAAWTAIGQ